MGGKGSAGQTELSPGNLHRRGKRGARGTPGRGAKSDAHLRSIDPALRLSNLGDIISYLRSEHFVRWVEGLRLAGLPE